MVKVKESVLKGIREKQFVVYKGIPTRLSADFSEETFQARREWHDIFNVLKGKEIPTKNSLPGKAVIQN